MFIGAALYVVVINYIPALLSLCLQGEKLTLSTELDSVLRVPQVTENTGRANPTAVANCQAGLQVNQGGEQQQGLSRQCAWVHHQSAQTVVR